MPTYSLQVLPDSREVWSSPRREVRKVLRPIIWPPIRKGSGTRWEVVGGQRLRSQRRRRNSRFLPQP